MSIAKALTIVVLILTVGAAGDATPVDYRQEMVNFVAAIASRARATNAEFGVIQQNAAELGAYTNQLATVTAISQEDLYYGYNRTGVATDSNTVQYLETHLDVFRDAGKPVFCLNYPFKNKKKPSVKPKDLVKVNDAYARSFARGYVPYATVLELNALVVNPSHEPTPNTPAITNWAQVAEWAVQLQPAKKQTREAFLGALGASRYDMVVIDSSFDGGGEAEFTPQEIAALKAQLGGKVVAYLSIGEAEDYRWYWQSSWKANPPSWLDHEDPDWRGNYYVHYWDPGWQSIIFAYLDRILAQGFDGVYLDLVDAYEVFENQPVTIQPPAVNAVR